MTGSRTISPTQEAAARAAEVSLRESEERFRTLADHIAQFAWMADPTGWIFWYNRRWYDYTGTDLESMQGWGWQAVHHPDHVERVTGKFRRHVELGEAWEDTFPLRGKDGKFRWFLSRAQPIRDPAGEVLRWFGTNTDITDRMAMEEALREADRRKDEFLATLAHELRNPLAPIVSGLELLRTGDDDPALRARVHEILDRQTAHLVRLIDDLLDVSRITRGKVELRLRDVELAAVVASALEASRPLLDEAGHELRVELPEETVPLRADPTRLAQVFSNLLNNAAKYTPPGGRVELVAERDGDTVEVRITDNGAGLDATLRERLFEMFVQGPSNTVGQGGLGIGLTLVRSLVELHGGQVAAESAGAGHGSTFKVRLPVSVCAPSPDASEPEPEQETVAPMARPLRVLIVDDNVDAADALGDLLAAFGHDARVVYDGIEALGAAADHRPHLVLLDLGMPGLDGYETARRLRRLPHPRTVIAALTGWGQEEDRRRTREAGFDHHLVKPADIRQITALLATVAESVDDP